MDVLPTIAYHQGSLRTLVEYRQEMWWWIIMADQHARRRFGRELEACRRNADLTQSRLAARVGLSKSYISDLERGRRHPNPANLQRLDSALSADGHLVLLWGQLTGSGRQAWVDEINQLISEATAVYDYQGFVFPGYLQTRAYARALIESALPWLGPDQVEQRAEERALHTKNVTAGDRPILWTVLDESVLWRSYGSPSIMRDQLALIASLVEARRLILQLIPAGTLNHPGNSGSFIIVTGPPEVVYAESVYTGQTITDQDAVARYRLLFGALQSAANVPNPLDTLFTEVRRIEDEHQLVQE